jgi:hypothetical protein
MKFKLYTILSLVILMTSCEKKLTPVESSKDTERQDQTVLEKGIIEESDKGVIVIDQNEIFKESSKDSVIRKINIEPSQRILDAVKNKNEGDIGQLPDHVKQLQKDYERAQNKETDKL